MKIVLSNSTRGAYHGVEEILKKNIASGMDNIVLVPDRFTASVERGIMQSLEMDSLFNVQVMSFTRLANKLIGGEIKKCLTPEGSVMLLSKVIEDKRDVLSYYGKSTHTDAFAGELYAAITSIRNSGISSDALFKSSESLPSSLRAKACDIASVYQGYLEALEEKHSDSSTRLEALAKFLECSKILNKHFYCIDFYDFKAPELEILRGLSKVALSLTIGVVSGFDNPNKRIYQDRVFHQLQSISEDKVEIERNDETLSEAVGMLSKHLFSYSAPSCRVENKGKIKLREASSRHDEVLKLALDIVSKVKSGARYRDFEIFVTDIDDYSADIKSTFSRYNIPFFIDKKALLQEQAKVRFVLSAISCARSGMRSDEVCEIIKNPMFVSLCRQAILAREKAEDDDKNKQIDIQAEDKHADKQAEDKHADKQAEDKRADKQAEDKQSINEVVDMGAEAIFQFENYVLKYNINYSQFDVKLVHIDDKFDMQQLEIVREMLQTCVNPFRLLGERKIQEFVKSTRDFLLSCDEVWREHIERILRLSMYYRKCAEQVDEKIDGILEEIDEVLHTKCDILGFENILRGMLKTLKIALVPTFLDSVFVGDIESRFLGGGDIYILGATSGKLEASSGGGTILSLRDEEILAHFGIEIFPNGKQKLFRNMLAICEIMKKPHGNLTISYPLTSPSGALRPSTVIAEIQNLLTENGQPISIEQIDFDRISRTSEREEKDKMIESLFFTEKSCYHEVMRNAISGRAPLEELSLYRSAYTFLSGENKKRLDNIFDEPERIAKEKVCEIQQSTSVSRLESFFSCPYAHYFKYILRLKKRLEGKCEGNESGLILHYIFEKFYCDLRDGKVTEKNIQDNAEKYFDRAIVACHLEVLMEKQSAKRQLLRIRVECVRILSDLYAIYLRSSFQPVLLEAEIGRKEIPPFSLNIGEKSVDLRGKIDRVDMLDGKFIIVDYKTYSSAKQTLGELYYGEKIQLYIYMKAIEAMGGLSPVGVFYLPIYESFVDSSENRYKFKGQASDDQTILAEIDNLCMVEPENSILPIKINKKGEFNPDVHFSRSDFDMLGNYVLALAAQGVCDISEGYIKPSPLSDTCRYCDFSDICAYQKKHVRNTDKVTRSSFEAKSDNLSNLENGVHEKTVASVKGFNAQNQCNSSIIDNKNVASCEVENAQYQCNSSTIDNKNVESCEVGNE